MKKEIIIEKIVKELKRQSDVGDAPYVGNIDSENGIIVDGYINLEKIVEVIINEI